MASLDTNFVVDNSKGKAKNNTIFQGNNYRITILSERLIRLEYSTTGTFSDSLTMQVVNRDFPFPEFKVESDDKYLVINTKYFSLQYIKEKPFEGPKLAPDSNLRVSLLNTDKIWFYGQVEARNFRGGSVSLDDYTGKIILDKGLYSTDGFVTLDDSKSLEYTSEGFKNPDPNKVDIYLFMYKRDFGLCLKDYYTLTGYPSLIPRYSLGIWWNKERIYTHNDLMEVVKSFKRHDIPLSVLLLSEFWHIKDESNYNLYKTGFTFNKNLFPDPKLLVEKLHESKIRLGLNIDPTEGIRKEEEGYQNIANSLNISDGSVIPFNVLDKNVTDLYLKNILENLVNLGIDVYWLDYKKSTVELGAFNDIHSKVFEALKDCRDITLTRNPLLAAHKAGILYSGETIVSWDTLKYLPFFNSMAANKGITWWSHDVGGYKDGTEDSELYIRYIEFSCFSPIFRFASKRGVYYKREPWAWDIKTYTIAKDYCNLRHRLIPYLYTEAYNYHKNGRPLIQPIYYAYPEVYDEPLYRNSYYFGKELFVVPITKPKDQLINRSVERIFLPKGVWYDFRSGKKFIGNKRYIMFYKEEEYPLFVKAGGIVPLANIDDDINNTEVPKSMEIEVFPGANNTYMLYEDDGTTKNYENGEYAISAIDYICNVNNFAVNIKLVEGTNSVLPEKRDYKIRFRNTRTPSKVEIYVNKAVTDLEYKSYQDENDFIVELKDVDTSKHLTVNCLGNELEINEYRIINEDINSIISDLKIETKLKEEVAAIFFDEEMDIKQKRIKIKKIKKLNKKFEKMFIKLLEYIAEI